MRWWRLTGPSSRCGTDTTTMTTPCTTTSHNLHQYSRKNPTCTLVLLQVWGNIYLKTSRDKVCRCGTSRSCPLCCYCVQLTVSERNVSSEYRMFLKSSTERTEPAEMTEKFCTILSLTFTCNKTWSKRAVYSLVRERRCNSDWTCGVMCSDVGP